MEQVRTCPFSSLLPRRSWAIFTYFCSTLFKNDNQTLFSAQVWKMCKNWVRSSCEFPLHLSVFAFVYYLIVVQGHSLSVVLCPGLMSMVIHILGQSGLSGSEFTALLETVWWLWCHVHPCQQFEINTVYKKQTWVSRPMPAQPREAHRQHFL